MSRFLYFKAKYFKVFQIFEKNKNNLDIQHLQNGYGSHAMFHIYNWHYIYFS